MVQNRDWCFVGMIKLKFNYCKYVIFLLVPICVVSGFSVTKKNPVHSKKKEVVGLNKEPIPLEAIQESIQNKDRSAAFDTIRRYLERNPVDKEKKEANRLLNTLAQQFFTVKAQQLYELALSSWQTDPGDSLNKLKEAVALEPDHLGVLMALGRLSLLKNNLSTAKEWIDQADSVLKPWPESDLLRAQWFLLSNKFKESSVLIQNHLEQNSDLSIFWLILRAELKFRSGDIIGAEADAREVIDRDADFPEAHYWLIQISKSKEIKNEESKSYLRLCKSLKTKDFRKYMLEFRLCQHESEVERGIDISNAL